ncbi:MAG: acyltransferase [Bdellovibrionia bacterium]
MKDQNSPYIKGTVFPALTGLRAIAAYLVFLHHFPISTDLIGNTLRRITLEFHCGVTVFFVLSGFLISFRYSNKARPSTRWFLRYMWDRFTRIYPMFFVVVVGTVLFQKITDPLTWIANLTFTASFLNPSEFVLPHLWSLAVEECFYLAAPLIFFSISPNRPLTIWRPMLAVLLCGAALLWIGLHFPNSGFFSKVNVFLLRTFFGHSFEFFCGIFLGRLLLERPHLLAVESRKSAYYTYGGMAGAAFTIVGMTLLQAMPHGIGLWHPSGFLFNNLVLPVFTSFLIFGLITERTRVSRILSTKVFDQLGKSSYCFYLIHIGVLSGVIIPDNDLKKLGLFLVTLSLSLLAFHFFENPLRTKLRALGARKPEEVEESDLRTAA